MMRRSARSTSTNASRAQSRRSPASLKSPCRTMCRSVSAEYFEVMRIPVRGGRVFTPADIASATHVALVNEALARRFWPNQNPVGKYVTLFKSAQARADFGQRFSVEIVGVVGNVRHTGLADEPSPEVYIPYTLNPW